MSDQPRIRVVPPATDTAESRNTPTRWLTAGDAVGRSLPALRSADFRLFWLGQLISLTGTWIQSVAQQWLVLQLTGSAFKLGLVTTVQFTPLLLLALIGGAISDRVSKRNLILATQVISGALAAALGILVQTGLVRYWHVLVFAAILGIINAFYNPARQAFVPELVGKEALLNAVALNSTIFNGARVIGPALGGILVAAIGLSLNFYLNAASFVAVIVALLFIHPRPPARRNEENTLLQTVGEGLRYIRSDSRVYVILALIGVASIFALNFTTLMPIFARQVLHVGSEGYGFLMASMGLGSLVGAITLAFLKRTDKTRAFLYGGAVIFTVAEIFFALSRIFVLSIALLIIVGYFSTLFTTTSNTTVLSLTPSRLQGRVMSVYALMFLGMTPFGSFLAGAVAEKFGAPAALVAGSAITLVFTVVVFFIRRAQRSTAQARPTSTS